MRMSAICRLARAKSGAGFTLLELLVVMTLLAAMTGLVLPRMYALYEAGERSFERGRVLDELAALPLVALRTGQEFTLTELPGEDNSLPVDLPAGWVLRSVQEPVRYKRTGICLGGRIDIDDGVTVDRYVLAPPHCEPR